MKGLQSPASESLARLSVHSGTSDTVLQRPHIRVPTEPFNFQRIYLHLSTVTDARPNIPLFLHFNLELQN